LKPPSPRADSWGLSALGTGQWLTSKADMDNKVVKPLETMVNAQNAKKATV
jgi:hypothetical protein